MSPASVEEWSSCNDALGSAERVLGILGGRVAEPMMASHAGAADAQGRRNPVSIAGEVGPFLKISYESLDVE